MADTSATVAARAERFSRIAEIARRDVDRFSQGMHQGGGGDGVGVWPVLDPPWVTRRRTEKMQAVRKKKEECEDEEKCVEKVVAMALGMGEQVGAMKRQLEEQSRQLKTLAVGHQNQTSLQQQLVSLLNTVQGTKPKPQAAKPHVISRLPVHTSNQGQTPQEYHTLTWLNSQKHIGKDDRSAVQGYKPGTRKSSFFSSEHKFESGSDRTRTTFGGTRRRFGQRSVCSVPTERSPRTESRKDNPMDNVSVERTSNAKKTKQVPLVAALYAKCKRRQQKRPLKLEKKSVSDLHKSIPSPCDRQVAESTTYEHLNSQRVHHEENNTTECAKLVQPEDSILDSMLSVHKYEDELKLRWLVPDVNEQERDIGKSIMDEMLNYRTGMTPRIREAVQMTVEKQWPKKEQAQQPSQKDHRHEWILEEVMDDALKSICCELLSFCDEFVEHMYMSEFLRLEDGT